MDQMRDEVVAGPQLQRGLGKLHKFVTVTDKGEGSSEFQKSPATPGSPTGARKDNVCAFCYTSKLYGGNASNKHHH